jgi:uncharacterized protein YggE
MSEPARPATIPAWTGVALAAVAVLLAVGGAYLLGSDRAPDETTPPAATPPETAAGGLLVTGTGTAIGVPDQLRFTVTVQHSASEVAAAMSATSADTRRVVKVLVEQGVERKDIRTATVSVQPNYRYSGGQELITGFSASEKISVKVRDIKIAGKVISATANVAGNAVRIGGLTMSVADPSALQEQARNQAVADARTKAEQYAEAAGRELGEVVVVEETSPETPYELERWTADRGMLSSLKAGSVPINPGTQTTKVYVTVRWSFA